MPFAGYKDFDDCVAKNGDKGDPKAYCATIMRVVEEIKEEDYVTIKKGSVHIPTDSAQHKLLHAKDLPHSHVHTDDDKKTITRSNVEETEKTYTPEEAGYVKSITPRKCGTCEYFSKPNQCKKIPSIAVDGELDCCNLWDPFDKKEGDVINVGMKEAHSSTSVYGSFNNSELDEDSYMKQALAFLSAAVKAHNMENQRPEMEPLENDYLMAAKAMLDNAVKAHGYEGGLMEITTLDDIPDATRGSSSSTNNIDFQGHNLDPQGIWMIVKSYIDLKNRGIPDKEALRAIAMEYGVNRMSGINTQYNSMVKNAAPWPPKLTGTMDNAGRTWQNLIPASAFSPALPKPEIESPEIESVAISGGLSNLGIGAPKINEGYPKLPPILDNSIYGGTASKKGSNQSMHGEESIVSHKQIPEESFYQPIGDAYKKGKLTTPAKISTQLSVGDSTYAPKDDNYDESMLVVPRDQAIPNSKNNVIEPGTHEGVADETYWAHYWKKMSTTERIKLADVLLDSDSGERDFVYQDDFRKLPKHIIDKLLHRVKEQVGYPPLKLRQMGKFVYANHGHTTRHQEVKGLHICEQLNNTIWDMQDTRRPILPMENAGITNTHPNCQCHWDYFTEIDPDPLAYAAIKKPTLNGRSLEDFNWKGKAIEHLGNVNSKIEQKFQKGTLNPINDKGKVLYKETCTGCYIRKMVKEAEGLRAEFRWLTPEYIKKIKDLQKEVGGEFYLVRASAEAITDHRSEGEPYRRKLDGSELHAMARTGIGKGVDINHDPRYKTDSYVMDGDYDQNLRQIQYLVHVKDDEINDAIDDETIAATSINGGAPRQEFVAPCDEHCESESCELCLHPRGVILGEEDGIAFTWVVTNSKGMTWRGTHMNAAQPGVKTTKIEKL